MANPFNENSFKREKVKQRLLKTAAELWDYQETEMEGFDPMVDLLFGACAVQFEKTARELHLSKTRVLKRLASLLLPEALIMPTPAHAIVHARPVTPIHYLEVTDQFVAAQEIINQENLNKPEIKEVYLSPALSMPLVDGEIRVMAAGKKILETSSILRKEELVSSSSKNTLNPDTLWLGLTLSPGSEKVGALSFYFDWRNNPEVKNLRALLPLSQWFLSGSRLSIQPGINAGSVNFTDQTALNLSDFQDVSKTLESEVLHFYHSSFVTLPDFSTAIQNREVYPKEFLDVFSADDLKNLKDPLLWIEIKFPQMMAKDVLSSTICSLNCFPALNRKREKSNRPYRVSKQLNILPLNTTDYLLTMHKVTSDEGKMYQNVPFKNYKELQVATYAVREEGVGRFDHRNASEFSEALLNLVRDENAAFEAIGGSRIAKELKEIQQNLLRLEKMVQTKSSHQDVMHYLILHAEKIENIWVEYWSTTGSIANRLPAGTKLTDFSNINYRTNSLKLITSTIGGKDKPDDREKVNAFRSAILSRGRIVTEEDMKAACFVKLGNKIKDVKITKGISVSSIPKEGLQKTIDIMLTPANSQRLSKEDWQILCQELQSFIKHQSPVLNTIRVRVSA